MRDVTLNRAQPLFLRGGRGSGATISLTRRVKELAIEAGLSVSAVTSVEPFDGLGDHLTRHIANGHVEGMEWFTADRARFTTDPRNLMSTAKSLLSVGIAYWSKNAKKPADGVHRGRIARYAWGLDYHAILKRRMKQVHAAIEREIGRSVEARLLTDTARIVDRAAAARAGLGWYGKHSCLIVPEHGSWVMLGELLLDIELEPDQPLDRNCGRCSICIDQCPTNAIVAPYTVDAPRCLSFQTIEQRGAIPLEIRPLLGDWVFGCDVCQDVCPYTGAASDKPDNDFQPRSIDNAYPSLEWLLSADEESYRATYSGTAVTRAKRHGLARNAAVALGNVGDRAVTPSLARTMAGHEHPLVRAHAAWALGALGGHTARFTLEMARYREQDQAVLAEISSALQTL